MIHFYIGKYRIEFNIRKVKFAKNKRKFLFIKYFKAKSSKVCRACGNVRLQFRNCKIGIDQYNKKSCRYQGPRLVGEKGWKK